MVSSLARLQAQRGGEMTTLLHQPLRLDPIERALVPLLDGTRDLATLGDALAAKGIAAATHGASRATARADATDTLRGALRRLAKAGALMRDRWPEKMARVATAAKSALALLLVVEFEQA